MNIIILFIVGFYHTELYAEQAGQSPQISDMLDRLKSTVEEELRYMRSLMGLLGTMETLFSVAESSTHSGAGIIDTDSTDSSSITRKDSSDKLLPSLSVSGETSS